MSEKTTLCRICNQPVDLTFDNAADENGQTVHEHCYVNKIVGPKVLSPKDKTNCPQPRIHCSVRATPSHFLCRGVQVVQRLAKFVNAVLPLLVLTTLRVSHVPERFLLQAVDLLSNKLDKFAREFVRITVLHIAPLSGRGAPGRG